jgi:twitching motility protein PilI
LRGIANLRGQLLTVVDLKSFLGAGTPAADRQARVLVVASRDVPTGLIVDEVLGFRRFGSADFREDASLSVIRCEHYLEGSYRRGSDVWPRFSLLKLLEDPLFLTAGETVRA